MNALEIAAKLCSLKEGGRDLFVKPRCLIKSLILEIYLKVADTLDIGKGGVVCEHYHSAVPVLIVLVDLLDLWNSLLKEALIRKPETDSLVDIKISRIVKELIIPQRVMKVHSVPVGAVVTVHTENKIALILDKLLYRGIVSVPVIYRNSTR